MTDIPDTSDPTEFFQGEEAEERFTALLRASMFMPPKDEREAAIRQDIYERNTPKPGPRR